MANTSECDNLDMCSDALTKAMTNYIEATGYYYSWLFKYSDKAIEQTLNEWLDWHLGHKE